MRRFQRVWGAIAPFLGVMVALTLATEISRAQQTSTSVQELVRQAVATELSSPLVTQNCTYEYQREVSGKRETLFMVKTSNLVVGKVVGVDNARVSDDQEQKEDARLRHLLQSSSEQEQLRKKQHRFEQFMRELVEALPDAFHYTKVPIQGAPGAHLTQLAFQPAPEFHPARTSLELLRGLSGTMVIDNQTKQIVKFEANLFRDIDFGWGIVVHLNRGGNLRLERELTGQPHSNIRSFSVNTQGRILLLKKLEIHWSFDHFGYLRRNLDLATAVDMLTTPSIASYVAEFPGR
jgi:hypothetical protein